MEKNGREVFYLLRSLLVVGVVLLAPAVFSPLGACRGTRLFAQCPVSSIVSSDSLDSDNFGMSVAVSGSVAIVGQPAAFVSLGNAAAAQAGHGIMRSAYMFRFDGTSWAQEQRLAESESLGGFGKSVDIDGNVVVVTDEGGFECVGAVYVYRWDGEVWSKEATLVPPDDFGAECVGPSVSLSGDLLAVGTWLEAPPNGSVAGAVHVYRHDGTNWIHDARIVPSDLESYDLFGWSVGLFGDQLVATSWSEPDGAIYFFERGVSGWVETQKLTAADLGAPGFLSWTSLALGESLAVVGAPFESGASPQSGGAYIVRKVAGIWVPQQRLTSKREAENDRSWVSTVVVGDVVAVMSADSTVDRFSFNEGAWTSDLSIKVAGISHILGANPFYLGNRFALDGPHMLVGTPFADGASFGSGSVHSLNVETSGEPEATTTGGLPMNRFVAFGLPAGVEASNSAIRVRLTTLHDADFPAVIPDFSALEGEDRWVTPFSYDDQKGAPLLECIDSATFGTTYKCATLGCEPVFLDWETLLDGSPLNVTGSAIVPSSTYQVQAIREECSATTEFNFSNPLIVITGRWGDVSADLLNVNDVVATVDRVKDIPTALPERSTLLRRESPEPQTDAPNVTDVVLVVDALKGGAYPYSIATCP